MDLNKVKGTDPHPSERRDRKPISDDARFQDEMRVKEVGEIDPDQRSKKKWQTAEEKRDRKNSAVAREREKPLETFSILSPEFNKPREKDLYGRTANTAQEGRNFGSPERSNVPSATPPPVRNGSQNLPSSYNFWRDNAINLEDQDRETEYVPQQTQQQQQQQRPQNRQKERRQEQPRSRNEPERKRDFSSPRKKDKDPRSDSTQKKTSENGTSHEKKSSKKAGTFAVPVSEQASGRMGKVQDEMDEGEEDFFLTEEGEAKPSKGEATLDEKEAGFIPGEMPPKEKEEKKDAFDMPKPVLPQRAPKKEKKAKAEVQLPEIKEKKSDAPQTPFHARGEPKTKRDESKGTKHKQLESLAEDFSPIVSLDEKSGDQQQHEKPKEHEIAPLGQVLPMTPNAIGSAVSAMTHVSSHITPEVHNLFAQMVGTIIVMTNAGISRTEVLLNSPAFQNSVFSGAKIVVEKYATAPDSFNIRLVGTNSQQVDAFNANLEGLWNAFDKGKFSFNIGRLDATFEPTRPLFRRKKSSRDKGSDLGDQNKEK